MGDLNWAVIRQDDNGSYRVGRFETREEAERIADRFDAAGHRQLYRVERIDQQQAS